ncbi:MAG: hypothetical protein FWG98_06370 [Candidatus Cloacimonetes bacterium]|nr:hypothetical protein [Candidatus Cloacimonadota bacterium]
MKKTQILTSNMSKMLGLISAQEIFFIARNYEIYCSIEKKMPKITTFLFVIMLLLTIACDTTEPYTGLVSLTIHLRTSNSADVIVGEFFLQNNTNNSQIQRNFAISSKVFFTEIETGEYSLIMGSQLIVDNISISEKKNTYFVQIEETEVKEIMEKAKLSYLDTFLTEGNLGATIDDISFIPFIGVFNNSIVSVFHEGKFQWHYDDFMIKSEIGNIAFYWPYGYPILAWDENTIYELSESYEQGLLSRRDLETIYISHWKHFGNEKWWFNKLILNADTIQRLKDDYINFAPSIWRENEGNVNDIYIHDYYGIFNNSVVLALSNRIYTIIDKAGIAENVAGMFFNYGKVAYEILVWYEGDFYRLEKAYTANLLTNDNIETIWHQYQEKHGGS